MKDYIWILFIIGIFIFWAIISWIRETISNSKKYLKLKPKLDNLESAVKEHELKAEKDKADLEENSKKRLDEFSQNVKKEKEEFKLKEELWKEQLQKDKDEIRKIAKQKSMGFPWLADAYADYFELQDLEKQRYLEGKRHPAGKTAEIVREIKNEKKILLIKNKIISYKLAYLIKLFPWLAELIAEDENEEIPSRIDDDSTVDSDNEDRVKNYLTPEEYKSLPSIERNQKALDRYLENRNKSKWAIGRDYEMYVGHLHEQDGYSVEYKGIIDGFDDLGRDIIATKNDEVCIIQCKYWAQYKEIHEKHVFQLFGTTMEYWIKNFRGYKTPRTFEEFSKFLNESKLRPIFFTSTSLSDKAKEMANVLSVEVMANEPIGEFPCIKCNTNYDEFGRKTKIYHLPMDQQYDRTLVTKSKGEFYAFTVKEAEDAGFRRAFKYRFSS